MGEGGETVFTDLLVVGGGVVLSGRNGKASAAVENACDKCRSLVICGAAFKKSI